MSKKDEDEADKLAVARGAWAPDGTPYAHNAEQAEAHKLARAEGDGPVSNETARAYLKAYPAETAGEGIHALAIVRGLRDKIDNQTRVIESLKDRVLLLDATVTACHAAMLGKVHPKSPAWGMINAVQDDEWKSSDVAIPHPTAYENP